MDSLLQYSLTLTIAASQSGRVLHDTIPTSALLDPWLHVLPYDIIGRGASLQTNWVNIS